MPVMIPQQFVNKSNHFVCRNGVYNSTACDAKAAQQDHAVVIVGWGITNDTNIPYWIVRNSWGTDWGLNGNFYLTRGINKCGIEAGSPAYVIPV